MKINGPSLLAIREYLDEMMYSLVDLRLSFEVERSPTGFPRFQPLQQIVQRLDPTHQVLFRLFRVGEAVEEALVKRAIPERILTALLETELLVGDDPGSWRTPSLLIVPVLGMTLLVGIPPSYPTATRPCHTWFDLSSYVMAAALPANLAGRRVLEACSGSGLQSLCCAARGAARVVGLELDQEAVVTARANAILNGLDEKVEFRPSDLLSGLKEGEVFDFVVCNSPYAPVVNKPEAPATLAAVGNSVLFGILDQLPPYLSEQSGGIVATWRAAGYQSFTYQMEAIASLLEKEGFSISAFVDRAPDSIDGVLGILQTDLEQRPHMQPGAVANIVESVRNLLQESAPPIDGFYNQLIYFKRGKLESPVAGPATFGLSVSG